VLTGADGVGGLLRRSRPDHRLKEVEVLLDAEENSGDAKDHLQKGQLGGQRRQQERIHCGQRSTGNQGVKGEEHLARPQGDREKEVRAATGTRNRGKRNR